MPLDRGPRPATRRARRPRAGRDDRRGRARSDAVDGTCATATSRFPVEGVDDDDLRDTFSDARGIGRAHEALDIMAPRRTPVRAVEDGDDREAVQQQGRRRHHDLPVRSARRPSRYYYAHLDRYAPGLREGQSRPPRPDVIGYVGSTGNASPNAPHLHFAIFRLTPRATVVEGRADQSVSRAEVSATLRCASATSYTYYRSITVRCASGLLSC